MGKEDEMDGETKNRTRGRGGGREREEVNGTGWRNEGGRWGGQRWSYCREGTGQT